MNKFYKFFDADTGAQAGNSDADNSQEVQNPSEDDSKQDDSNKKNPETVTIPKSELQDRINRGIKAGLKQQQEEANKAQAEKNEQKAYQKLTADQKKEYDLQKLQDEIRTLKSENTRNQLASSVRGDIQKELGLEADDNIVGMLTTEKADSTKANVDSFIKLAKGFGQKLYQKDLQGQHIPGNSKVNSKKQGEPNFGSKMAKAVNTNAPKAIDPWKIN